MFCVRQQATINGNDGSDTFIGLHHCNVWLVCALREFYERLAVDQSGSHSLCFAFAVVLKHCLVLPFFPIYLKGRCREDCDELA